MAAINEIAISWFPMLLAFLLWVLPVIFIAFSRRVEGSEKTAWLLGTLILGWLAYFLFILIAPIGKKASI